MNIIELQERLKDLPEQALMQEMQMPSGTAPQFLVLSELKRRKRMRDEYQRQQAQGMQTVAEEAVTAAGAPAQGIMQMSRAMAPQSAIAQNTGVNDMMQQESVRAPQPEQPMMMADGGVLKMQPGGFTDRQQQGYLIFLQDMGLADSPQARDMYIQMMQRQQERGVSPQTFMPGLDRAPEAMSLADVSADVDAFMPGAEAPPPTMMAPPALGAAPSVGTVDFDASIAEAPPAPPPSYRPETSFETLARITGEAADVARGMGIPIPESQPGINIDDIVSPGDLEFGTPPAPSEGRDRTPILPQRLRDAIDAYQAAPSINIEDIVGVGDLEYGGVQDVTSGESDLSLDRLIRDLGFDRAMDIVRQNQAIADERAAAEAAARAPRPVETQPLSFGLGPADVPTTGADLSFGGVTPSAADIPLATGVEPSGEPTPEFPLGTPVPAVSSREGGTGGGAGGGADFGPIESRIARMLEERERSAQADKWLALAQTGLALMASDQPTLGGAIGEAGLAGIGALQQARSQYDKDIMELLDMQAGVQRARASGARAGTSTSAINSMIDDARQELSNLTSEARSYRQISDDPITGEPRLVDMTPPGLRARIVAAEDRLAQLNALRSGGAETAQFDATAQ